MVRVHHLSKDMVLGPADSGTTFVSAAGGRAWLSGGRVIRAADAAWQPIPGSKALKAALFFFLFFSFFLFFFFFAPGRGVVYALVRARRAVPQQPDYVQMQRNITMYYTSTDVPGNTVVTPPPKKTKKTSD